MVGFSRFLRASFGHQVLNLRGLSTEPALAPFRPSKIAVRTTESDPTKHTSQDVGKLYTMPDEVRRKLFDKYVLPLYFERFIDIFNETNIIVREPALELIDYMKKANYDHPVIRYVLYGKYGCGKTLTLVHAMNYAWNNGFLILYVPSVWKWYHWSREVVSVDDREQGLLDLPLDGSAWLKHFEMTNGDLLTKLDLRVTKTHEWTQREKTEEGAPLKELISFGINRVKFSCQVIDVLLQDLKFHCRNKSCKLFVAIDGYNGFFQRTSRLKTKEFVRLIPENVSLTKSFIPFVKNDWINGAVVLVVDDHANVKGDFTSHFPFHLLKKVGVETIDPFIPINVPEYSPLEFQNYLDYLEEMRWLQRPEGRDEIEFITQRNPRLVNMYCANR